MLLSVRILANSSNFGLINRPKYSQLNYGSKISNSFKIPSNIQKRYNSTGDFFRLVGYDPKLFNSSLADAFIEPITQTNTTILQFTDLHYTNTGNKEDKETVNLIGTIAERVKPDLVVLTGEIVDERYCGNYSCFRHIASPLIELGLPWTLLPGYDDRPVHMRKDLLSVLSLPLCISKGMKSFSRNLKIGPLQLYLFDSNVNNDKSKIETKDNQIEWYNKTPTETEVGLTFLHIPFAKGKQAGIETPFSAFF